MKQLFSLLLLYTIVFCSNAQVYKTVEVPIPGTLSAQILQAERFSLTDLTITGLIDARDFKFIRDSLNWISVVDFGAARIMAYSGNAGTDVSDEVIDYSADEIPPYAFSSTNVYAITRYLKKVVLSSSTTSIGYCAFAQCAVLDTIRISASITNIGKLAFSGSSAVFKVDLENQLFRDTMDMLFDKSLNTIYHCPISKHGDCILPSTLKSIAAYAFYNCTELKNIEIPKSVILLGANSFFNCTGLKSIEVFNSPDKISLGEHVFYQVRTDSCILNVPLGKIIQFRSTDQWRSFSNIQEHSAGLVTNVEFVNLLNDSSTEAIYVRSNVSWRVQSDQSWLNLDKTYSLNNDTVVVSAATNTSGKNRVAHLVFSAEGIDSLTLTVTQSAPEVHIQNVSGDLANRLKAYDQHSLMMLKLGGTMDNRDFLTLNDSLPMLTSVDLSEVHVTAWKTDGWGSTFLANTIPVNAFTGLKQNHVSTLSRVILPSSTQSIDYGAFFYCTSLKEVIIPDSVTTIGSSAFFNCFSMKTLMLGKMVNQIGDYAFNNCIGLKNIWVKSEEPVLFDNHTDVFSNFEVYSCVLHIPFGTKKRYAEAPIWKNFEKVVEDSIGFLPEASKVKIAHSEGSLVKLCIHSTVPWTAQSNQPWLQVSPASGLGTDSITLTVQSNVQSLLRSAEVIISTLEYGTRTIVVTQEALPKTIQMNAGELSSLLTSMEMTSISTLILEGAMDGRDFLILRDSMPLLNNLDLSQMTILKYDGGNATSYHNVANTIPRNAFFDVNRRVMNKVLESVILPESITDIGDYAFGYCQNLKFVSIPDKVNTIEMDAFSNCISLTKIVLPKSLKILRGYTFNSCTNLTEILFGDSLTYIGGFAFYNCKSLKHIDLPESLLSIENDVFSSCTSLSDIVIPRYVTNIESNAFNSCTALSHVALNNQLQFIGSCAFQGCSKLTDINLPSSINTIGLSVFSICPNLRTVVVNSIHPSKITLMSDIFSGLNLKLCTLYVPYHTKALYAVASQWKNFGTILEAPYYLTLDTTLVELSEKEGSSAIVAITANTAWTAYSDQDWLTISKSAGSGDDNLRLTAFLNEGMAYRTARVTIQAVGVEPQTVLITQESTLHSVVIEAGGLADALSVLDKSILSKLKIDGVMDARDFKTIRDNLPNLVQLDISGSSVASYVGTGGTTNSYTVSYPANTIPPFAFYSSSNSLINKKLQKVLLPTTIIAIGNNAFYLCMALDSIQLPITVKTIGTQAFEYCQKLTKINLPEGMTSIQSSFRYCISLETIDIPESVTSLASDAFYNCNSLKSITVHQNIPISVGSSLTFNGVDRSKCLLYIPSGTKERYASANVWKEFIQIVEMETSLEKTVQSSLFLLPNPCTDAISIQGLDEATVLTILDMKGLSIFTKWIINGQTVSVEGLAKGAYLILLKTSKGNFTRTLIKK